MTSAIPIPISFSAIAPEIILLVTACVLLTVGVFLAGELARRLSAAAAAIALTAAAAVSATQFEDPARFAFDHTVRIDAFGQGARMLIFVSGLLAVCVAFGMRDLRERGVEYHALLLSACAGMSLLCGGEQLRDDVRGARALLDLPLRARRHRDRRPALAGGRPQVSDHRLDRRRVPALRGSARVRRHAASWSSTASGTALSTGDAHGVLLLAGLALVLVGLGFKANAAPFHMWTPDAYEGAPTPVTAFMSAATKVVALVIALRVLVTAFPRQSDVWEIAVAGLVFACFIAGNLGALRQKNVKRMLAYSTVAHSGFLLTAVAANSAVGGRALLYYLTIYAAMNVGAFAIVAIRERELGRPVEVADFAGWGYRRPMLSIAMVVFMLSLAGFPPTGGFLGKLYIWSAAVANGQTYLAIAGAIATAVGLVYYLRVPFALFDRDAAVPAARPSAGFELSAGVSLAAALVVVGLGIIPSPLIDLARTASASLFG